MNTNQIEARIKNLEAELKRLNSLKGNLRIEDEFAETFPFVKNMLETPQNTNACITLSILIRQICFPPVEKKSRHRYNHEETTILGTIPIDGMTVEQRETYSEIVRKVLDVLKDYEILSRRNQ